MSDHPRAPIAPLGASHGPLNPEPERRWSGARWSYSLILPVALLLVLVTLAFAEPRKALLELQVTSNVSGEAIPGAAVAIGNTAYIADEDGEIVVERPERGTSLSAASEGYEPLVTKIASTQQGSVTLQLKPSIVQGVLRDRESGEAIGEADVALLDASGNVVAETRTDSSGSYLFKDLPANSLLRIYAEEYGVIEEQVWQRSVVNLDLERSVYRGKVLDDTGAPLQGTLVQSGDNRVVTGTDGEFTLEGVGQGAEVRITAAGFRSMTRDIGSEGLGDIALEPQTIKAVYASRALLADPDGLDSLIDIANTTEINAIVIDIKQDTIYYDSQVEFFRQAGTVAPIYDARELVRRLEENNIYPIARLVVFQDPLVAEAYPQFAVHDSNGELWRNEMGVAWVSAFNEELWNANIELAVEAIELGFAEVQYDYVRFPSDGDLSTADFGREYTAQAREDAITEFMRRSYEAVHTAGGLLAADLFGFVTIVDDEQYIGQRFSRLLPYLDYVCMMIYPSHFSEGNIASADGHPNDFPYETIYESLERAEQIAPGAKKKFRPWLQDFSYGSMREYGAADVRAQIDAAEDYGASGWMLWGDPFNVTVEALRPDD